MEKSLIIDQVRLRIQKDIVKDAGIEISNNDPLISSGLIDSFSLVDLALIVEELYKVRIEDYELNSDSFDTLNELAEIINARLPAS
jgi:acyl carrier protein